MTQRSFILLAMESHYKAIERADSPVAMVEAMERLMELLAASQRFYEEEGGTPKHRVLVKKVTRQRSYIAQKATGAFAPVSRT